MANRISDSNKQKKVIYRKTTGAQGICSIWDWDADCQKYKKRTSGVRFYAYKKIGGLQKAKSFEAFEDARKWRSSTSFFDESETHAEFNFEQVSSRFFEHKRDRLRITTLETYRSNWKHLTFFNQLPMSQLNSRAVDEWLKFVKRTDYLKMQHQNRLTYRHELSLLRQILVYYSEYLSEEFRIPIKKRHLEDCIVDPVRHQQVRSKDQFKFIPRRDCDLFLETLLEKSKQKENQRVYFQLALFQMRTGTRVGEACAIRVEDIDFERGQGAISKTVQWARAKGRQTQISPLTKTGEARVVPLTLELLRSLKNWIDCQGRIKGLVFSFDGVTPISYRSVQHYYNSVFESLGLPWTSTHILRHSFATDFLEKTRNHEALQGILGHKSSRQTDHYAKITESLMEGGMKQYEASTTAPVLPIVRNTEALDEKESTPAGTGW